MRERWAGVRANSGRVRNSGERGKSGRLTTIHSARARSWSGERQLAHGEEAVGAGEDEEGCGGVFAGEGGEGVDGVVGGAVGTGCVEVGDEEVAACRFQAASFRVSEGQRGHGHTVGEGGDGAVGL